MLDGQQHGLMGTDGMDGTRYNKIIYAVLNAETSCSIVNIEILYQRSFQIIRHWFYEWNVRGAGLFSSSAPSPARRIKFVP